MAQAEHRQAALATPIERLNGESERRTDVMRIFPIDAAVLVTAILLEPRRKPLLP